MGRNQSLGSPKSIFRQILISKHVQDHFWENRNFGIFVPKNTPKPIFGAGNIIFGSFSGQIGRNLEEAICKLFPKKNPPLNGYSFLVYPHFCENWPEPKKTTFSHFLQNTVLDPERHIFFKNFEEFRFWAFRKVYGLWGYFRPKKSYSHLKFQHTTVTHLCFGFTHLKRESFIPCAML